MGGIGFSGLSPIDVYSRAHTYSLHLSRHDLSAARPTKPNPGSLGLIAAPLAITTLHRNIILPPNHPAAQSVVLPDIPEATEATEATRKLVYFDFSKTTRAKSHISQVIPSSNTFPSLLNRTTSHLPALGGYPGSLQTPSFWCPSHLDNLDLLGPPIPVQSGPTLDLSLVLHLRNTLGLPHNRPAWQPPDRDMSAPRCRCRPTRLRTTVPPPRRSFSTPPAPALVPGVATWVPPTPAARPFQTAPSGRRGRAPVPARVGRDRNPPRVTRRWLLLCPLQAPPCPLPLPSVAIRPLGSPRCRK